MILLKIILGVIGIGITIFIHELGHFIMARRAGVRVEVFSIGFGPVIWKIMEKNGTSYVLSLIPLGGYVKMLGQEDIPSKEKQDITDDHYLAKTPGQRMGIIIGGVAMNFILAYILMIVALWIGISFIAPEVGSVAVGSPAAQEGGFQPGDKILSMNGKPIYTFIDVKTNVVLSGTETELNFRIERNGVEKDIKITPVKTDAYNTPKGLPSLPVLGIAPAKSMIVHGIMEDSDVAKKGIKTGMEIVSVKFEGIEEEVTTAERLSYLAFLNPGKKVTITYKDENGDTKTIDSVVYARKQQRAGFYTVPLVNVMADAPAARAGIENGDIITEINGTPVRGWEDILSITRSLPEGTESVPIKVKRGDKAIDLTVKPFFDNVEGRYWFGLNNFRPEGKDDPQNELFRTVSYVEPELTEAGVDIQAGDIIADEKIDQDEESGNVTLNLIRDGEKKTVEYTPPYKEYGYLFDHDFKRIKLRKGFFSAFGYAVIRYIDEVKRIYIFLGKVATRRMSPKMMGGIVQIANITYRVIDYGFGYYLYIFSLIGLSLAVLNILPVPVLDGGALVFLLYEMIRGKPASEKVQVISQYIGLAFILMLVVYVTYNDILKIIG